MSKAEELFEEFVSRFHAGERFDTSAYLAKAGDEMDTLAEMIEVFLTSVIPPTPSSDSITRAFDIPAVAEISQHDFGSVLSQRRKQTGRTRALLSKELAEALGLKEQSSKVKRYYADLENGILTPVGLHRSVIEAIAGLLDISPHVLSLARRSWQPQGTTDIVFARTTSKSSVRGKGSPHTHERWSERDEVDQLFLGGAEESQPDES